MILKIRYVVGKDNIILMFPNYSKGGAEKAASLYLKTLSNKFNVVLLRTNAPSSDVFPRQLILYVNYFRIFYRFLRLLSKLNSKRTFVISFKGHIVSIPLLAGLRIISNKKIKIIMRESNDILGFSHNEINSKFKKYIYVKVLKQVPSLFANLILCNSKQSRERSISTQQNHIEFVR